MHWPETYGVVVYFFLLLLLLLPEAYLYIDIFSQTQQQHKKGHRIKSKVCVPFYFSRGKKMSACRVAWNVSVGN